MKPKKESTLLGRHLRGMRIRLDDVNDITALLEHYGATVAFEDDQYEYMSLEEFTKERGLTPKNFEIRGHKSAGDYRSSRVGVTFDRDTVYFHAGDDELEAVSLRIWGLLNRRRVSGYPLAEFLSFMTGLLSVVTAVIYVLSNTFGTHEPNWPLSSPIVLLPLPLLFLACQVFLRSGFGVVLRRRHEGGFFKRNQDALVLNGAIAVLGAAAGSLITYWLTRP